MASTREAALEWIRTYRNFPQLYTVGRRGFPIGRSTIFPINDDWSITATGYRGNARVRQIAENPHVEAMWIDTRGEWDRVVRVRGLAYHTDSATLVRVYDEREDAARAKGEGFGQRLSGQKIIDTVCCTHIVPKHVVIEGFDGAGSSEEWDVMPDSLLPAPPAADGTEPKSGPTGFRQPLEMSIAEVSAKALGWARASTRPQYLCVVGQGFPAVYPVRVKAADDWTTEVALPDGHAALNAMRRDPHVELAWIDANHDAGKMEIPVIVFVRARATVRGAVARLEPTRIRTEGFGKGLQLYAWNT